jgi:hypothetical protein
MNNIVPYSELQSMAKAVTTSGMFGLKNENQAVTLMLIAQAENIHPIQAIQKYVIIKGLPSLKSTEVQARFQKNKGSVKWIETTNKKAVCELKHPDYDGTYLSEFGEEDAKLEGLLNKDNYKRMPKAMYMARAMTRGVRAVAPDCLNNMYSVEEAQSIPVRAEDDIPMIEDVEVIEEVEQKPSINSLKLQLSNRLKELSFSSADVREFADKYELNTRVDLLSDLVNSKELLMNYVADFEGGDK